MSYVEKRGADEDSSFEEDQREVESQFLEEFPDEDDEEEIDASTASEVEAWLSDLITENSSFRVHTFEECGVMTSNKGLVVKTPDGEFQLTIMRSR